MESMTWGDLKKLLEGRGLKDGDAITSIDLVFTKAGMFANIEDLTMDLSIAGGLIISNC